MKNRSKLIRFAIVGFGYMGKRHAEMIQNNEEAELVAIIDPKFGLDLSHNITEISRFLSLKDFFLSNISADVIVIASPNGLHAVHALEALSNHCHIVVEKPLALNVRDAEKIRQKALFVGKKIFPVVQNRYSHVSTWLKNVLDCGRLGKIFIVQVNCFWNRDERYYTSAWKGSKELDGGTLFTQFYHFIDLLYWLFGDIKNVHARFADFNHMKLTEFEDSGFVNFDFVNGGMGSLNYSTAVWSQNLESSLTIIAENGSVKVSGQYMDRIEHCTIKDYVMPVDSGDSLSITNNHKQVISNVIEVLTEREGVVPTVEEGIKVIDIITRIYSQLDSYSDNAAEIDNIQLTSAL